MDDEAEEGALVHQFGAVAGAVGEQMLSQSQCFAHAIEDHLRAGAIGDVDWGEVTISRRPSA